MTGHLCGGAGALGALAAVLSIRNGVIPATANLERPDVKLDIVAGRPRFGPVTAAMVDAFGFGGHNVILAFTAC
jgi:3-oxoacyl-[acyl-carrier-protein] synthase II